MYKNSGIENLFTEIRNRFGQESAILHESEWLPFIEVDPGRLFEIVRYLKEESSVKIDFLDSIAGTDLMELNSVPAREDVPWKSLYDGAPAVGDGDSLKPRLFMVTYHFRSFATGVAYVIKVILPEHKLEVSTIDSLFGNANWLEREVYDLIGIVFKNSRDLRRLLLPEDWVGFPLRRDYTESGSYAGMSTQRPDPLVELKELALQKKN